MSSGGLIVFPTDTVYGLGCNPKDEGAVSRLFEAKGREAKPVPVLCASKTFADKLVKMGPVAQRLAGRFWPGRLTIVSPLKSAVPFPLHQGTGALGVRVPSGVLCRRLIRECGGCLTGTSANLSGRPSSRSALQAARQLGDTVDLVLDGGALRGSESTVVKVAHGKIEILRQGPVRVTDKAKTA